MVKHINKVLIRLMMFHMEVFYNCDGFRNSCGNCLCFYKNNYFKSLEFIDKVQHHWLLNYLKYWHGHFTVIMINTIKVEGGHGPMGYLPIHRQHRKPIKQTISSPATCGSVSDMLMNLNLSPMVTADVVRFFIFVLKGRCDQMLEEDV